MALCCISDGRKSADLLYVPHATVIAAKIRARDGAAS
jgi:hypothetical protein